MYKGIAEAYPPVPITTSGSNSFNILFVFNKDLIIRNGKARVMRDGELLHEGLINSLKRHKDDAKEVKEGLECGIGVDGVKKFIEGDIIEVYEVREVKRKLELN